GVVDVDVHRAAVRSERDAGELAPVRVLRRAPVLAVAGERVHLAAPGDAEDVLGAAAVLAHHQAAAGRQTDVVRGLAGQLDVGVGTEDDHQGQPAPVRVVAPDLAVVVRGRTFGAAGEGRHEVHRTP